MSENLLLKQEKNWIFMFFLVFFLIYYYYLDSLLGPMTAKVFRAPFFNLIILVTDRIYNCIISWRQFYLEYNTLKCFSSQIKSYFFLWFHFIKIFFFSLHILSAFYGSSALLRNVKRAMPVSYGYACQCQGMIHIWIWCLKFWDLLQKIDIMIFYFFQFIFSSM
jgi:hypothetical protein